MSAAHVLAQSASSTIASASEVSYSGGNSSTIALRWAYGSDPYYDFVLDELLSGLRATADTEPA